MINNNHIKKIMSKEKFLKFHLFFFEIISIGTIIHSLGYLLYYSMFMRFDTTSDLSSMLKASINFTHNYTQNNIYDIKFNITDIFFENIEMTNSKPVKNNNSIYNYSVASINSNISHNGFLILSKNYFNLYNEQRLTNSTSSLTFNEFINSSKNNLSYFSDEKNKYLSIVQNKGIEHCFIFLDGKYAAEALNILFESRNLMYDNWNSIIFVLIILFFFFMKLNITFELTKILNKFKYEDFPNIFKLQNFYIYFIFNGTLIIIIPLLYFGYDDYNFDFCLGFSEAYFNSFFADRQILLEKQIESFDPFQTDIVSESTKYKNDIFFVHNMNRNTSSSIIRLGYLKNMLFLCVFVWISGIRNMFKIKNFNSTRIEVNLEGENNNNTNTFDDVNFYNESNF